MKTVLSRKTVLRGKIREYLISSMAPDGTIRESDLALRFGVSRTPVREALNEFEKQGVLVRRKKAGTSLRILTAREIADIYDLRSVLEGHATRLLCRSAAPATIRELSSIEEKYQDAVRLNDYGEAVRNDLLFHETIINSCGNSRLARLVQDCHLMTEVFRKLNVKMIRQGLDGWGLRQSKYPHALIIGALKERNEKKAERLMQRHIEWTMDTMLRHLLTREES